MSANATAGVKFQAGGTVRSGSVYVSRAADEELPRALLDGEYCYVLAPRQMGKSSLKVRAAERLEEAGVRTVDIDLSEMKTGVDSVEQLYLGLIDEIVDQLALEIDVDAFWQAPPGLSEVHRWSLFLRKVLVKECADPVVVFIDEIDNALVRPYASDDLFASLRASFNRRPGLPGSATRKHGKPRAAKAVSTGMSC